MDEQDKDKTIFEIFKEGNIEYKRIIPKEDKAFELSHKSIHNKNKIILFITPGGTSLYKMFIYKKQTGILYSIEYNNKNETWSVFNALSLKNKTYHE